MTGLPIEIGYPWRQDLEVTGAATPTFPAGATWTAHVKRSADVAAPIGALTVSRLTDQSVRLEADAALTALLAPGRVLADIVRTDVAPDEHTYITLDIEVVMPITRAGGS